MPEISVIVPNYNHGRYLGRRLETIFNQTFTDYEVILLDDCSTDNSREILEKFSNNPKVVHCEWNKVNSGSPFYQWEKGIRLATGKWVWIAESDDEADPRFLEVMVNLAENHENVGIAYSGSYWIDDQSVKGDDLSFYDYSFYKSGHDEIRYHLWRQCTIPNVSSALLRRDIARECIAGLGRYKACGDWIFYTRMLGTTHLAHTHEKLNYFRWYHENTSQKAWKAGLWVTEGVHLLPEIDLRKTYFSGGDVLEVVRIWMIKSTQVSWRNRPLILWIVFLFMCRYFFQQTFDPSILRSFIRGVVQNLRRR